MAEVYSFGRFRLYPRQRVLLRDDAAVRLGGRALDILIALAERAGEVVPQNDIAARVWPDTFVETAALRVHMVALRKALAEGGAEAAVLNVPGRGYCLTAEVTAGEPAVSAAAPAAVARHNLPPRISRLIGRSEAAVQLAEVMRTRRLVTVVGSGGMGKTVLALDVAEALLPDYGRVVFVDYGPLGEPAMVSRYMAAALGLAIDAADASPGVVAGLQGEKTLLVFDNCEHLVDEVAALAEGLLRAAPECSILTTSREALRAEGEWVHRLGGLSAPEPGPLTAREALAHPAVELFVERAAAALNGFVLADEDAEAAGEICRRLDGMPLAIELAAPWVAAFPLQSLAGQIGGQLILQAKGRRTALPRHQTLQAMLDWSYDRLPAAEQTLFCRLSVFRRDFDLSAVQAVTEGDGLEALGSLLAKSLLEVAHEAGVPRYRLLAVPRTYALKRLDAGGEGREVRRRHAALVLDWLRRSEADWMEAGRRRAWMIRHVAVADEVRAALDWALSAEGDLGLAIDLTHAATAVWFRLSLTFEGRAYAERTLELLASAPDRAPSDRMRVLAALAVCLNYTRAPAAKVVATWQAVQDLAETLGDAEHLLLSLWGQWLAAVYAGEPRTVLALAERFAEVAEARATRPDQVASERMVAAARYTLGDLTEARTRIERLLAYYDQPAPQSGVIRFQFEQVVTGLTLLSRILWLQGDPVGALAAARRSVTEAEGTAHMLTVTYALLDGLVQASTLVGDLDGAQAAIARYAAIPEAQGLQAWEGLEAFRGVLLAEQGRYAEAAAAIRNAWGPTSRIAGRFPLLVGRMAEGLGRAGDPSAGLVLLEDAFSRFVRDPDELVVPELYRARAELTLMAGGAGAEAAAEALFETARAQSARQGAVGWDLRIALGGARLRAGQGRRAEAAAWLRGAMAAFVPGAESADLRRARELLAGLDAAG